MMKLLRYLLVLSFLTSVSSGSFSQTAITLTGRITDQKSNEPLSFAQLILEHTQIGTTANEEGYFMMHIPPGFQSGNLVVASMGYVAKKVPVSSFTGSTLTIELESSPLTLTEVEVIGYTPQEVIRRAIEKIPENYGSDSVLITAYVRVQKIVGNRLAEFTEAILEDMKDGYYLYASRDEDRKKERSNIPAMIKGRVNSDTVLVNSLGTVGKQAFCLGCNFTPDLVEFYHNTPLDEKEFSKYNYRMTENQGADGSKIYHIRFDQKAQVHELLFTGEIIVKASDFGIEQILLKPSMNAFDTYEKNKFKTEYTLNSVPGWFQEMPMGHTALTYSKRGEFYTLSTIRVNYTMTYIHPIQNRSLRYQYKSDVVVTNIERNPEVIRSYKGDKSIGKDQRWDQIIDPDDESFWSGFNYLPIEESLKSSIPVR